MYERIEDFQNDPSWYSSIGEQFWDYNFRSGHYHAVCDSMTDDCSIHYDKYDPYESLSSLVNHLANSKLVMGLVLLGLADELFNNGSLRKELKKSLFG